LNGESSTSGGPLPLNEKVTKDRVVGCAGGELETRTDNSRQPKV